MKKFKLEIAMQRWAPNSKAHPVRFNPLAVCFQRLRRTTKWPFMVSISARNFSRELIAYSEQIGCADSCALASLQRRPVEPSFRPTDKESVMGFS